MVHENQLEKMLREKMGHKVITKSAVEIEQPVVEIEEPEEPKKFTIPNTCGKLESIPKNVRYIEKPQPGTTFVVKLDERPHVENPDRFRQQILDNMYVYIDEGDEEYSIDKFRGSWPFYKEFKEEGGWKLKECKSLIHEGESIPEGFLKRLHKLTYINGTLVYEHGCEQYRIQLSNKTCTHFCFYLYNYQVNAALKKDTRTILCDTSWWIRCSSGAGSEGLNNNNTEATYKDLKDNLQAVIENLMESDSCEKTSADNIRFLQGAYKDTPHHDYKDHDGNPCGIMEYYCSKTWTNEHYTLMTQKGDRAWDIYRWIIGYITSMDFMSKNVEYRHFIWFACRLSSIGKSKMLSKCFPHLVFDPNPSNGKDTFSKRKILECPLLVADDGDLVGLAKNDSYLTRLNKRVGNGTIPVRLMREEETDIKRTVFNMSISNVEPPKELYSGDATNILTSKCRYVYVNLSDAIYHDDSTSIVNIDEVARKIGRTIPAEYTDEDVYSDDVDIFKSDCLRFYKANPEFMDKYLGAMKQSNTSGAKTCFEDYIDYAEANNAWSDDTDVALLGTLFRKQISCLDDYAVLKKYFDKWAKEHNLQVETKQKRIPGLKGNPIRQPMVSKEMIMKLYE